MTCKIIMFNAKWTKSSWFISPTQSVHTVSNIQNFIQVYKPKFRGYIEIALPFWQSVSITCLLLVHGYILTKLVKNVHQYGVMCPYQIQEQKLRLQCQMLGMGVFFSQGTALVLICVSLWEKCQDVKDEWCVSVLCVALTTDFI